MKLLRGEILCYFCVLHTSFLFSKVLENPFEQLDHLVLSDRKRILIENAISPTQVHDVLEFCLHEPKMQLVDSSPSFHGAQRYSVIDINDVFRGIYESINPYKYPHDPNYPNLYDVDHSNNTVLNSQSKRLKFMKTGIQIQSTIIDYAEAFFQRRYKIKTASVFKRDRLNIENITYSETIRRGEESDDELNVANGWLVALHCDNCVLSNDWDCDTTLDSWSTEEQDDFTRRDISVVIFLNDLPEAAGGEFVFVDPDRTRSRVDVRNDRMKKYREELAAKERADEEGRRDRDQSDASPNQNSQGHKKKVGNQPPLHERSKSRRRELDSATGSSIPPPSREAVRRQLAKAKSRARDHQSTDGGYTKSVHVLDGRYNYTLVIPRPGRMVMFNSSIEQIHAVTNLIRNGDQRYTLFMFLTEVRD